MENQAFQQEPFLQTYQKKCQSVNAEIQDLLLWTFIPGDHKMTIQSLHLSLFQDAGNSSNDTL